MNAVVVSGQETRRMPDVVRIVLRRGTRVGHYCSSVIGFAAIVGTLALWFQPAWRAAIAERVMSHASTSSSDASAAAFLSAMQPSASAGPRLAALQGPRNAAASVPGALSAQGMGAFGAPLDPSNLPSVVRLVQPMKIVADARYDRQVGMSMRNQQRVASYIAHKYRVAQEPIDTLVQAAFQTGRDVGIDPLLLLAVVAVESSFNPYAESGVGARGLMQVMATVHSDKFDYYGGPQAALEPVPNLRVGALILKTYIAQTGSIAGGLRRYVGATTPGDGGYGVRVVAERERLRDALRNGTFDSPAMPATVVASAKPLKVSVSKAAVASASASVEHVGGLHATAANGDEGAAKAAVQSRPTTNSTAAAA